jgi:hypothetical protein
MTGPAFTCPVCGRTSHNPNDVAESYCGACHGLTTAPPPPGFRWVLFVPADERRRFGRLLDDAGLEPGADYIIVAGDQEGDYVYDGERFVEAPA